MAFSNDRNEHCPFLNRADSRCGEHFHLDQLDHAFEFCFDRYTSCPTYLERLVERRLRQDEQPAKRTASAAQSLVQLTIHPAGRNRQTVEEKPAAAYVSGHAIVEPVAVTLGKAVAGPRISAASIFRGFDRFTRRGVVHREVSREVTTGRAA